MTASHGAPAQAPGPVPGPRGAARPPLDLRAYACPITWVKTRVALERLGLGEVLEVWLSPGEPAESVPRSAAEDGHRVLGVWPLDGDGTLACRLLLEKGAAPPALP